MANPNVFPQFLKAGAEPVTVYPRFLVDSFVSVPIDTNAPVHISQIVQGDHLKIVITPRHQLEIQNTRTGPVLIPRTKGRNTRAQTKTVIFGRVMENRPDLGYLKMNAQDGTKGVIPATVPYTFMRIVHKIVPDLSGPVETAPATHPGAQALGTKLLGGRLLQPRFNLVNVRF